LKEEPPQDLDRRESQVYWHSLRSKRDHLSQSTATSARNDCLSVSLRHLPEQQDRDVLKCLKVKLNKINKLTKYFIIALLNSPMTVSIPFSPY
jgi:hypothetical protein